METTAVRRVPLVRMLKINHLNLDWSGSRILGQYATYTVITDEQLKEFKDIIRILQARAPEAIKGVPNRNLRDHNGEPILSHFNWLKELPYERPLYSSFSYEDKPTIEKWFGRTFGESIDPNIFIKFFRKFTPSGAEAICRLTILEVTDVNEITL